MSSRPRPGFLSLPRELRDTIYRHYLFEPEGYHFNLASGKLCASDNRPVNLALLRTCTAVAAEMHHLPLRTNVLHFSTSADPSESERIISARFGMLLDYFGRGRIAALRLLREPSLRPYQTPVVDAKLALKYPQFAPLLHWWSPESPGACPSVAASAGIASSWGEPDSDYLAFQSYMIELLTTNTDFVDALAESYVTNHVPKLDDPRSPIYSPVVDEASRARREHIHSFLLDKGQKTRGERASFFRSVLSASSPEPWTIPSLEELAQMMADVNLSPSNPAYEAQHCLGLKTPESCEGHPWKRVKWRFSAAAAAVHFFKSISQETCSANPQLRIERRVNMWRVLLSPHQRHRTDLFSIGNQIVSNSESVGEFSSKLCDWSCITLISDSCCRWITEASGLAAKGMPAHSFSLVLDGDPAPDKSSELFERVKEAAAWQVAQAQWYSDQSPSPGFIVMREDWIYRSEVFPQAINDIVNGKSFISCNFPTGTLHDPRAVLNMNRHIVLSDSHRRMPGRDWFIAFGNHQKRHPMRFLPQLSFIDFAAEELLPEEHMPLIEGKAAQASTFA
ncbi:hypothetical protein XANCAGTX0491_007806 [Xanthoria calcicola]